MTQNFDQLSVIFPYFPELATHKTSRIFTKHYTNLFIYMNQNELSLLTWLVYESGPDNTIDFNIDLVRRYRASVFAAIKQYKSTRRVNTSINAIKSDFKCLVIGGYLLAVDGSEYLINPMLTHVNYLNKKQYKEVQSKYQSIESGPEFAKYYKSLF